MTARALSGACLERLVRMAGPLLRAAQRQCPRTGPGRTHDYLDWQIAALILIAILHRRKSKSAQYRFLLQRRAALQQWLDLTDFPARSTYFARYRQAHRLFRQAIGLQGAKAIAEGLADPTTVAVDKSLIPARGHEGHPGRRRPLVPQQPPRLGLGLQLRNRRLRSAPRLGVSPAGLRGAGQRQRMSHLPRQGPASARPHTLRARRRRLRQQRLPGGRRTRPSRSTQQPTVPLPPPGPRRQAPRRPNAAPRTTRTTNKPTPKAPGLPPQPTRKTTLPPTRTDRRALP